MRVIINCVSCKEDRTVTVDQEAYQAWKHGAFIQDAMPRLSAADQELLISHICGPCFDKAFADDLSPEEGLDDPSEENDARWRAEDDRQQAEREDYDDSL